MDAGFTAGLYIEPDYTYLSKRKRISKNAELHANHTLDRIWDAGKTRWVKKLQNSLVFKF